MTRDETVALFEACEARRADARAASKSSDEAHEAAKAHWNAWARKMLAEKKAHEYAGRWDTEKENWGRASAADFSRCRFLLRGDEGTAAAPGEVEEEGRTSDQPSNRF